MKKYHIFISYSRKDDTTYKKNTNEKSAVDIILESLKKENLNPWIDRDGKYCGSSFTKEITKALKDSELLLFISSANSNDKGSRWVFREVIKADKLGMKIVPLRIDETPYNDEIDIIVDSLDPIDFYKNKNEGCKLLIEIIKAHIEKIELAEAKKAKEKEEEARRLAAEKETKKKEDIEKKRVEKLKDEMAKLQTQLMGAIDKQQHYLGKWIEKRKELLGEASETTKCPICESLYDEKTDHCEMCGWYFGLPKVLLSEKLLLQYDERLTTSSIVWEKKKEADNELNTLKNKQRKLETDLKLRQKKLEQDEALVKIKAVEGEKALLAKQEQITRLDKALNESRAQLAVAQKSINELKRKAEQAKESRIPIAFLLVTEFGQSDVYLLYEGLNVFGALGPQTQSPEYQMIVTTEEKLMPRHFEIRIDKKDKYFEFKVRPLSSTCSLAYNSTTNIIKTEQVIRVGDILYIGRMKIHIIDNFNK